MIPQLPRHMVAVGVAHAEVIVGHQRSIHRCDAAADMDRSPYRAARCNSRSAVEVQNPELCPTSGSAFESVEAGRLDLQGLCPDEYVLSA